MYVCVCKAVKDGEIRAAVKDGHTSLEALADKLGVGTGCGCCREYAEALIGEGEGLTPSGTATAFYEAV